MTEHKQIQRGQTEHVRTGEQSVRHRREFAAPAALVQRAHTDPELFIRWLGPRGTTVRLDRFDATTGGAFRYVVESASGGAWAFRGSYHFVAGGVITHTWEYEDEVGVTLETLQFTDLDSTPTSRRSLLEVHSTYTSKAACDEMLASGLDGGMDENFERLDEVLASLAG